jgi:hypothetical protein
MANGWAGQQLAEFLTVVSICPDEGAAFAAALEWTAEALEAEVAAIIRGGEVIASLGFPTGRVPVERLVAVATAGRGLIPVPPGIECRAG